MFSRTLSWLVGLVMLLVAARFGYLVQAGDLVFETDLIALLPNVSESPLVEKIDHRISAQVKTRVVAILQSQDSEKTNAATDRLSDLIRQGIAQKQIAAELIDGPDFEGLAERIDAMLAYKDRLIGNVSRQRMQDSTELQLSWRMERVTRFPPSNVTDPVADPLGTLEEFLTERLPAPGNVRSDGLYLKVDSDTPSNVLLLELYDGEIGSDQASASMRRLIRLKDIVADEFDIKIALSGIPLHAAQIKQETIAEIFWMGALALILTLFLFLYVTRSLKALLITATSMILAIVGGLVIAQGVIGLPHLIGLTMATTAIGICIDFSFHFWVHVRTGKNGFEAINAIRPALNMSFVTTTIGLFAISLVSIPVLARTAVFICGALLVSWLLVLFVFPLLSENSTRPMRWPVWYGIISNKLATGLILGIVGMSAAGFLFKYHADDSPLRLGRSVENLVQDDRMVSDLLGYDQQSTIYLLQAESATALLQAEDALLEPLTASESTQVEAVSKLVVSDAQQQQNKALFQQARENLDVASLRHYLAILGVSELDWQPQVDEEYSLQWVLAQPWASVEQNHVLTCRDLMCASMIRARGHAVRKLDATCQRKVECIRISFSERQTASFKKLRGELAWSLLLATGSMFIVLYLRYRRRAFKLILVPIVASVSGIASVIWAGMPVTAFTLAAIFPLLGLSVDYAVFANESGKHSNQTFFAIFASAVTTATSFAILAFSGTAAVQFFALPVAVGIPVAWISVHMLQENNS